GKPYGLKGYFVTLSKVSGDDWGLEAIRLLPTSSRDRREETTTVTLDGITALAVVTFRESYIVKDEVEDIKVPLGPLFEMFFEKKSEYKTTADFKKFMESDHALGIEAPEKVKAAILKYVSVKETKPYLKMEEKTDGK
ncbi:MAG: hypothetical protein DCC43_16155, partial [Candidatus Brocadia sp.]